MCDRDIYFVFDTYKEVVSREIRDISIPNIENKLFNTREVPFITFEPTYGSRYLVPCEDRRRVTGLLKYLINCAYPDMDVKKIFFEYENRKIDVMEKTFTGYKKRRIRNNDLTYLLDQRYTSTGRISKNAYLLIFYAVFGDKAYEEKIRPILGKVYIKPDGTINRAIIDAVIYLKNIDGEIKRKEYKYNG